MQEVSLQKAQAAAEAPVSSPALLSVLTLSALTLSASSLHPVSGFHEVYR